MMGFLVVLALVLGVTLSVQNPAPPQPTPTFDVASVKPNTSGSCTPASDSCQAFIRLQPGGNFLVGNTTLRELIRFAYGLQNFQLVSGPDWIANERFDITAKASNDFVTAQGGSTAMLMLRTLLAERFRLRVRRDTREIPVYALVLARSDAQVGPQLRRSEVDCNAVAKGVVPRPPKAERPVCGLNVRGGTMIAGAIPISGVVDSLSQQVDRLVIDRTGLTGVWTLI